MSKVIMSQHIDYIISHIDCQRNYVFERRGIAMLTKTEIQDQGVQQQRIMNNNNKNEEICLN